MYVVIIADVFAIASAWKTLEYLTNGYISHDHSLRNNTISDVACTTYVCYPITNWDSHENFSHASSYGGLQNVLLLPFAVKSEIQ